MPRVRLLLVLLALPAGWLACNEGGESAAEDPSLPDRSTATDGGTREASSEPDAVASPDPFAVLPATLALAEAERVKQWAKPQDGMNGLWDILYDGVDDPSVGSKWPYLWDVPSDDDWDDPQHSFLWNTPAKGFVTVNRKTDPVQIKAGRFTRRDEFLTHETGMTLSVKYRLLPESDPDAFFVTYVNQVGSVTALISPDHLKVGGGSNPTGAATIDANSTGDIRQLWMTQAGGSTAVSVYPDTNAAPITTALDPTYKVGTDENVAFPYILVGDNSNQPSSNAAFVVDEIKYRRGGGLAPLSHLDPTSPLRTPPSPLPRKATKPESFGAVFEGDALHPPDPGGVPSAQNPTCFTGFCTTGSGAAWKVVADPVDATNRFFELDNRGGRQGGARVESAPGLTNEGDLTMEIRFRLFPDSQSRGFGLLHLDERGSFGASLDPDGVEVFQGVKPFGVRKFAIDLTDRFHKLRMVRKARELYVQYYLDDHEVPIIMDEHLDGSTEHRGFPVHPLVEIGYIGLPARNRECHLLIDYLRFTGEAWGP